MVHDDLSVDDGLPDIAASYDSSGWICEECEHPAIIKPQRPSVLRRVLRMRPRPAECPVRVEDVSAYGTLPCGCRDSCHGS